jgi:group II intron reverse transcriptase/maturase
MSVERRNQQNLARNLSTQPILRDGGDEQKSGVSTLETLPERWLRISLAAQKRGVVFNNLLSHIKVETLREAYQALDKNKAVGLDGVSKISYGKNLEANLVNLANRIHTGSYKPQDKRIVLIPKANGKTRPIAISCFEDKLVEHVVANILQAIYDNAFIKNSFGFRPNKSADGAIRATYNALWDNKRPYVVEIDFANFFGSIPHRKLLEIIGRRVSDNKFKGLIGRFLQAGYLESAQNRTIPSTGTPQGSIMSPILANLYLHEMLDTWFMKNYASYDNIIVRYADDAVFLFSDKETADDFVHKLYPRVQEFGLSLNTAKTNIIYFDRNEDTSFDFLGFTFYWGLNSNGNKTRLKIKTQKDTLHKKIQEFYLWIKSVRSKLKTGVIWELAKSKLRGHYKYYGFWMNRPKLAHFYSEVVKSLFKWLNRRSQIPSFNWKEFLRRIELNPLPPPPQVNQLKQLGWNPYV